MNIKFLLVSLILVFLVGCGGSSSSTVEEETTVPDVIVPVEGIKELEVSITNNNPELIELESGNAIFNVKFSQSVSDFDWNDVTVVGGDKLTLTGSGSNYTLEIAPFKNTIESIRVDISPNVAQDENGTKNKRSNYVLQRVNTQKPFITKWKTDNEGGSFSRQIVLPIIGSGYDYKVDWGDGQISWDVTGKIYHTYKLPGIYTVKIYGDFPRMSFGLSDSTDQLKLLSIEQWGTIEWDSMNRAFLNSYNLKNNANDVPDLSLVEDMSYMFSGTLSNTQQKIGEWDTSNVKDMSFMFERASSFNSDISSWNTASVVNMDSMFKSAKSFNQPLTEWNTSKVVNMNSMFDGAIKFNQDISSWNTANVANMNSMFKGALSFSGEVDSWNVTKVTDMSSMFQNASNFNGQLQNWVTANVENMKLMFEGARKFNQTLATWNTGKVHSMYEMFKNASSFNQNLSAWDVSKVTNMTRMFVNTSLAGKNYVDLIGVWPLLTSTR